MLPLSITSFPEVREEYPGQSIVDRTARLHPVVDLGPPDLCTLQKVSLLLSSKTPHVTGTYLFFSGVDTSSSAPIAAHLQSIAALFAKSQYWFAEKKHWRVPLLTYCLYNAFSRIDMRVTVHIPGTFQTDIVAADGSTLDSPPPQVLDKWWLETFVSSILRLVLVKDDDDSVSKAGGLVEIRKRNPFGYGAASAAMFDTFIQGFEQLFADGPKLGCNFDTPLPSCVSNLLVDGFIEVIRLTQHYEEALEMLHRIRVNEPRVDCIIVRVLLLCDLEVAAVQLMTEHLQSFPRSSDMLVIQANFCLSKNRPDLALPLARQAVKASPLDFKTWLVLVRAYTHLQDYGNALLLLNSCPMNSHREQYSFKRVGPSPGPNQLHLPFPTDVTLPMVSDLQSEQVLAEQKALDPQLASLPAQNLRLTFASAYDLLTDIALHIGWKRLLEYRAKVFVMEEEYRRDRRARANDEAAPVNDDTTANTSTTELTADDDASTLGVISPRNNSTVDNGDLPQSESAAELRQDTSTSESAVNLAVASQKDNGNAKLDSVTAIAQPSDILDSEFKKKRLCERWLDNLFILLYEDLRVFTLWQAEYVHLQAQQLEYKKTPLEWEVLGLVAFRLKHFQEGHVAYHNALKARFLVSALWDLLKYYQMEYRKLVSKGFASPTNNTSTGGGAATAGISNSNNSSSTAIASTTAAATTTAQQALSPRGLVSLLTTTYVHNFSKNLQQLTERILEYTSKLLVWNHRWYCDFSPKLLETVSDLVAKEGLIKFKFLVQAVYSNRIDEAGNHGIIELMEEIYAFLETQKINGADN